MGRGTDVYLEVGKRRTFAAAVDWPGWCRSGRDEGSALEALVEYGPRYAAAIGDEAGRRFRPPAAVSALQVVERIDGNATTDFGAPGMPPAGDGRPLSATEARQLADLLQACWLAFDRAAESASGDVLRKGPRGGGRDLGAIVLHVLEADGAYLSSLGGHRSKHGDDGVEEVIASLRRTFLEVVASRARGEPPPRTPRSGTLWSPRYAVRRSAWHSLDHAWEIEDRRERRPRRRS
jgi:hypothetical protein